jgi:hypothetical protein
MGIYISTSGNEKDGSDPPKNPPVSGEILRFLLLSEQRSDKINDKIHTSDPIYPKNHRKNFISPRERPEKESIAGKRTSDDLFPSDS